MKADHDVHMIRAEAPVLFAKASELFILDLTIRAYAHAASGQRRNLQKDDVYRAVANTDIFDFLERVLQERIEENAAAASAGAVADTS